MPVSEICEFIKRRFPTDQDWTNGNCYYFSLILKNRFGGKIYYDVVNGHFVTRIDNQYFDYNGIVDTEGRTLIEWDRFCEYDRKQKKRIKRDCIK